MKGLKNLSLSVAFWGLSPAESHKEIKDQIANICWIIEKLRQFQKNIYFCLIDYAKPLDVVGREVGGGFVFGNACTPLVDSCQCMAKTIQYGKVKIK